MKMLSLQVHLKLVLSDNHIGNVLPQFDEAVYLGIPLNAASVRFSQVEPAKVIKTASSVQDTPFSKVLQETV